MSTVSIMPNSSADWSPGLEAEWRDKVLTEAVLANPFVPITPTLPQAEFLTCQAEEVLYGGAAGGGKSVALLAAALMYVTVPGYNALLIRRTFADLSKPEALIPLARAWLTGKAHWNEQTHTWLFASGATLSFGYLESESDKYNYQSSAFQFIGFDELTHFTESTYTYLFSRLRRKEGLPVPLRMRGASNPGGIGHDWVRKRFYVPWIKKAVGGTEFIPAKLDDNPYLDKVAYEASLEKMSDPIERQRLRDGNWDVQQTGRVFDPAGLERLRKSLASGRVGHPERYGVDGKQYWRFMDAGPGPDGSITVWEEPRHDKRYCIGVDFAFGIEGGDYDCGVLVDGDGMQVAEIHGHYGERFGDAMDDLLDWYSEVSGFPVFIVGERTATGLPILRKMMSDGRHVYYERDDAKRSRPQSDRLGHRPGQQDITVTLLRQAISYDPCTVGVRSEELHGELCRFSFLPRSGRVDTSGARDAQLRWGAVPGEFDDRVRAMGMACAAVEWLPQYEPPPKRFAPGTFGQILGHDEVFHPAPEPKSLLLRDPWKKRR